MSFLYYLVWFGLVLSAVGGWNAIKNKNPTTTTTTNKQKRIFICNLLCVRCDDDDAAASSMCSWYGWRLLGQTYVCMHIRFVSYSFVHVLNVLAYSPVALLRFHKILLNTRIKPAKTAFKWLIGNKYVLIYGKKKYKNCYK